MGKIMCIGQAMPRVKRTPHDWPTLNSWFYSIGLNDSLISKHFFYTALVNYFPGSKNGSHLVPTKEQILEDRPRLIKDILSFSPDLIIPIGKLSIQECMNNKSIQLDNIIGSGYVLCPYSIEIPMLSIIPLPHPSGASTWRHMPGNKARIESALETIKSKLIELDILPKY